MGDRCAQCHKVVDVRPDIPHVFEELLRERSTPYSSPACNVADAKSCYKFNDQDAEGDALRLHRITVCNEPIKPSLFDFTPNSGSHRILIELSYLNEHFVVALEEKEALHCSYVGDIIIIGAATAKGMSLAGEQGFVLGLVSKIITRATGVIPILETTVAKLRVNVNQLRRESLGSRNDTTIEYVERFDIRVTDASSVLAEGCLLSPAARGCALIF